MKRVLLLISFILLFNLNLVKVHGDKGPFFIDVKPSDWFYEDVNKLVNYGILKVYEDNTFKPYELVKNNEFIEMFSTALRLKNNVHLKSLNKVTEGEYNYNGKYITRGEVGKTIINTMEFDEIENIDDYSPYVRDYAYMSNEYKDISLKLLANGIITGFSDRTFRLDEYLTRAEVSVIILRCLEEEKRVIPNVSNIKKLVPTKVVNPYVEYGYDEMIKDAKELAKLYPDIIKLDTIGKSVEGRDLLSIKFGKGDKTLLFVGSHHAREYISTTYLMKMLDEYSYAYATNTKFGDYNIKELLDNITLHIIPMVNPDGVNLVQNGLDSVSKEYRDDIKNMIMIKKTYREWKSDIRGVDLNRQYPAYWNEVYQSTNKPSSEVFKGYKPASEPEVIALMNYVSTNNFSMGISYHTKGEVLFWHDTSVDSYRNKIEPIIDKLSKLTEYEKGEIKRDPKSFGGGFENWFRKEYKKPGIVVELTPLNNSSLPHPDKEFDSLVWKKAKYIGAFFMDEAIRY